MKKIKYLMLLVTVLSMIGCSDLVEEPIKLLGTDAVFQEAADLEPAVSAAYTHAVNEEVWGRKLSLALLLRSDMGQLISSESRRLEMDGHFITADNEMVYDPWKRIYLGITAANSVISASEIVTGDSNEINQYVAQARFIKAFYYFHLVRLFGDVPYPTVKGNENLEELKNIFSTPETDVYANIIEDLKYAEEWLPTISDNRALPSKAAAKSYLALVYLTMAGTSNQTYFQLAYDKAKEVINNKGIYDVDLDLDFQTLFNANLIDGSKEPIFALDYNNVEAPNNAYDQVCPMTGIRGDDDDEGWSIIVPAMAVYNSFDENDYRTRVSFQTEAVIGGVAVDFNSFDVSGHGNARNRPYIAKFTRYPGAYARGNKRATSHNYSMMRYAEVLLIAAEAGVEIGAGDAMSLLNQVRARARRGGSSTNGGYVSETIPSSSAPADLTSITVDDVLEERRIELAFESKRWYDIKRRQLGDVVFSASGYEGAKGEWSGSVDYDTPIPETELAALPNITN